MASGSTTSVQKGTSLSSDSVGASIPKNPGEVDSLPVIAYKRGDVIGRKYEVYDVLGAGGFGVAYLVYSQESKAVYVLKTFRDEYLADTEARARFRKEASAWVGLERHPFVVRAHSVVSIDGRLLIALEHIAPDESGLNTLEGHLRQKPPDLAQSLCWSVQFCQGMEFAYSKGLQVSRR